MKLSTVLLKVIPVETVYAHCDIPCGVYDPTPMQIAAHTVLRMTTLINDLTASSENAPFEERKKIIHDLSRITRVKEEHGERVEDELGTLENDYFKPEHMEKFPELKRLIADTVKLSVETRQKIDLEKAGQLLEKVLQISEIFYKSKNVTPVRVPSLYPTKGELVTYK